MHRALVWPQWTKLIFLAFCLSGRCLGALSAAPACILKDQTRAGTSITVCFHTAALAKDLWTLMGSCRESEREKGEHFRKKKDEKRQKSDF